MTEKLSLLKDTPKLYTAIFESQLPRFAFDASALCAVARSTITFYLCCYSRFCSALRGVSTV